MLRIVTCIIYVVLYIYQLGLCPLVWMFCSRQTNNMINELHKRALRLVLNDHVSDFEVLLRKSNDISCHHRNIQMLMIELYKIKNELAPPIMDSMLNRKNITYNFRNLPEFQSKRKKTAFNSLETLNYRAPQLWTLLPEEIKQRNTINLFRVKNLVNLVNSVKNVLADYQSVCTKPRIYLTYGSYLCTIYDLNCFYFFC